MGVLKTLTDEYFEKSIRTEEGKYLEIKGCKLIVPVDCDEKKFFETLKFITWDGGSTMDFFSPYYLKKEEMKYKCNNDYYFLPSSFENFCDLMSYDYDELDFDEKLYNACCEFIAYMVKNIDIYSKNDNYIILADDKLLYDFNCAMYDAGIEDSTYEWDFLVEDFFDNFGEKADITQKYDFEYTSYGYGEAILLKFNFESSNFVKILLYAEEMQNWWKTTINGIEKNDARDYFGLEEE